ncbi:MAG: helix-turn-helix domain-containing protein [Bacillales bacterium]
MNNIEQIFSVNYQLGLRIRFLRKEKKYSIEDLALECNINTNYLSDLERGKRNPTLKVLYKICNGLNINLEELMRGIG